jgi:hypothetical protein
LHRARRPRIRRLPRVPPCETGLKAPEPVVQSHRMRCGSFALAAIAALAATALAPALPVDRAAGLKVREGSGHSYRLPVQVGEHDLHVLAGNADREDSWLRIGDWWMDIGFDEREGSVQSDPAAVLETACRAAGAGPVTWYHIHPRRVIPPGTYPPSMNDLFSLAMLKSVFRDHGSVEVRGKVFDGYGVWRFDAGPEFLQSLPLPRRREARTDSYEAEIGTMTDYRTGVHLGRLYVLCKALKAVESRTIADPHLGREERIERFISEMRLLGVRIGYKRLE